ncbi:MAG: PepSY domain-containing protein [Hyphomonas sp.]|nr:PepSY domain-containing protein [Hyphomonas sp.]
MKLAVKSALIGILVAGPVTAGLALADPDDARALSGAKISLIEAIQAAEAHTNGAAFDAQIEDDSFSPEFEVGVVAGNTVYEVRIDGETGNVISAREDRDD